MYNKVKIKQFLNLCAQISYVAAMEWIFCQTKLIQKQRQHEVNHAGDLELSGAPGAERASSEQDGMPVEVAS